MTPPPAHPRLRSLPFGRRASLTPVVGGLLMLGLWFVSGGVMADTSDPADRPAIRAPLVSRSLFLDGDARGDHMVLVGERGHIIVSRDAGMSWAQARVPTRATLTGVSLADGGLGWAVGHDAVILRTADGGDTWETVFAAPAEERPLLDVYFENARHGFAVGAYGLFLETRDGGETWSERQIATEDHHLNHIAAASPARLYLAAERGTAYRSDDGGETWASLPSPYAGSFFGTLPLDESRLYLFGLRGRLFYSTDAGGSWEPIDTGGRSLLTGALRIGSDRVLFTGVGGTLLAGRIAGKALVDHRRPDRAGIAGALDAGGGALVVFGEFGVERLPAGTLPSAR